MVPDPSTDPTSAAGATAAGRAPFAPRTLLADGAVAAFVVTSLYALLYAVPLPPFGVPGYLLVVAFDRIEALVPALVAPVGFDAGFAGFLAVLAVVAAVGASWARARGATAGRSVAAGAAVTVVGVVGVCLALGVFLRFAAGDYAPLLLVGATSVLLLFGGRYLAVGRFGRRPA
ncbi:hypothetical protein [Halobaculum lipolyticum]|uniref:TIGR04206 family protein n=1 Tax=Halobaculum lipolyticum TaxID=3032001 RepID=A0ABD5WBC2_9EURY|nr:hypothetical protein [Halobaculum sp. DT31]